jgi:hypothetical protein
MGIQQVPEVIDQQDAETLTNTATRRTLYVFGSTVLFALIIIGVNYSGESGMLAEKTVEGAYGIIELLVMGFLFAGTVDRSQILHNVGRGLRDRWSRTQLTSGRDPSDEPQPQTDDQAKG